MQTVAIASQLSSIPAEVFWGPICFFGVFLYKHSNLPTISILLINLLKISNQPTSLVFFDNLCFTNECCQSRDVKFPHTSLGTPLSTRLKRMAIKIILLLFESADLICFKTFYRLLISFLMYKISRFVWNKIFVHSAILDIHFYHGICVTSQPGKRYIFCGHFHNKSCSFTFSVSN